MSEQAETYADGDCLYDLVGVLVHSGPNLQFGHYYSFIRDRTGCTCSHPLLS